MRRSGRRVVIQKCWIFGERIFMLPPLHSVTAPIPWSRGVVALALQVEQAAVAAKQRGR